MSDTIQRPVDPGARTRMRTMTIGRFLRRYPYAFAIAISIAMLIVNISAQPNFGLNQQLASFAPLAVAAMASTPAIVSGRGGLDLSISPLMVLSAILFIGYLTPAGLGGVEAIVILVVIGAAIGALNGVMIVHLRLQPIVVTLSMMFILTGVNTRMAPSPLVLSGSWVYSLSSSILGIPGGLISLAVPVLLWLALTRSAYGRNLFAVGGNDATAYSAGINVGRVRIIAYALGGAIAGFGGLVLVALISSADATVSGSYTLTAIAAVVLGGTSLAGGRGGMVAAIAGAAAIFLVQSVLTVLGVPQIWLSFIYGAMLFLAVVIGAIIAAPRKKGR